MLDVRSQIKLVSNSRKRELANVLHEKGGENMRTTYINFHSYIFPDSVSALMSVIQQKIQQGIEKIVLLISSPGGQIASGLTLYNFLKRIPVEMDTHNYGRVDSMAVAIYCAGKRRFCTKNGKFFMHEIGHNVPRGKRLEPKELKEILRKLKEERDAIVGIIAENCGRKAVEIDKDMEKTKGLDAEGAKKYGLVHEIKEELFPRGADTAIVSIWPRK